VRGERGKGERGGEGAMGVDLTKFGRK